MKINITKNEYRLLVEMIYLSDWVMNSHHTENSYKEYEDLRNKFLSYFKDMDAEDIIEESIESKEYYETNEFNDYMHEKFINSYDEETFWNELIDRLALRDVIKGIGLDKFDALDRMERAEKLDEMRTCYANEFENHGLGNIKIEYEVIKN